MEVLRDKVKFEETIEGMQEEEHEHGGEHDEEHGEGHEEEYDEHVWLSLSNAMIICKALKDEIVALDYDNKNLYESNFSLYIEKLKSLDNEYKEAINSAKRNKFHLDICLTTIILNIMLHLKVAPLRQRQVLKQLNFCQTNWEKRNFLM